MDDNALPRGTGATLFISVIYTVLGAFNLFQGLVLIIEDEGYVATTDPDLVIVGDFTTWGWVLLLVGIVQLIVSAAIFNGALWARVIGIVMASLAAIAQLPLLASGRPFWSMVIIGLCIWVVHGLAVYGEPREA